jgi:peptide-methionine (S)-S-oxide reductase
MNPFKAVILAAALSLAAAGCSSAMGLEAPRRLPAPAIDAPASSGLETAVLAGGCFWGVQGVFQHVKGVKKAVSGYAGGAAATARYGVVGTGTTGHAESVQVTFDPKVISYGEILRIFFSVATDPTQVGGQFPDRGPQYRGVIFYANPAQKRVADAYIAQLNATRAYPRRLSTEVAPLKGFYAAEDYHQDYLHRHPTQLYIATYDLPKVKALQSLYPERYAASPVLVAAR